MELYGKSEAFDIIYCDLQKAFDTGPDKRLIDILQSLGRHITRSAKKWIKDGLQN